MEYKRLEEIIEFNPTETLKKGTLRKKISMDKLGAFSKYINSFEMEEYTGGMKFRNGDTLLARITPCLENGKTSKVTILDENEVGFGSTEYIVMRSKKDISDEDFIFYLAISPEFRNIAIKSMTGTSGRQRVQLDVVKNTEILVPSYQEQIKIGKVLSSIDKKIELNNQINDNLHELMFTLYQKESDDIENNQERTLDEFCNIFTGRKNANEFDEDGENKFFTCGDKVLRINSYIYNGPAIIISGNGSYTGRTLFYNGKFDLYQRTYACTLKDNVDVDYIYGLFAIVNKDLGNKIKGGTHGSAIPYIVMNDLAKFKFKFNESRFKEFSKQSKVILDKIQFNEEQNEVLKQLRDTLLPKMMNDEINLDKIIV